MVDSSANHRMCWNLIELSGFFQKLTWKTWKRHGILNCISVATRKRQKDALLRNCMLLKLKLKLNFNNAKSLEFKNMLLLICTLYVCVYWHLPDTIHNNFTETHSLFDIFLQIGYTFLLWLTHYIILIHLCHCNTYL